MCSASSNIDARLQAILDEAREHFALPGLSFAIKLPGEAQIHHLTSGFTTKHATQALTANSLFQMGSITKSFTAALATKAINEHLLNLHDTVIKFLPQYKQWANITIEELLNQTSGIWDYLHAPAFREELKKQDNWSAKALIDRAYAHPPLFPPGSAWSYSNTNYVLLGVILEKVYKTKIAALMQQLINHAGLTDTFYADEPYSRKLRHNMAHGYRNNLHDVTHLNGSWLQAAGALLATPQALVQWEMYLYTHIMSTEASLTGFKSIPSGATSTDYTTASYRLGIFRMNTPYGIIWFTPGLTSGYSALAAFLPCYTSYFAYAASSAPVPGLHEFLIAKIMPLITANFAPTVANPYCVNMAKAANFSFPNIG
jgi:D-alanyl-D-alanine carboxypeptidase